MKRVVLIAVGTVGLAGCATTSDVVPIGGGNYEIAGSSVTALSSGGSQKVKLMKIANQYCGKQGKQAAVVAADSTDGRVGNFARANAAVTGNGGSGYYNVTAVQSGKRANADVVFRCE